MKRAALVLLVLCAANAGARVISYAPYTDRIGIPAFQSRTNRHFALVEASNGSIGGSGGIFPPSPVYSAANSQLVVYDSGGLEEPRVVFPPDGSLTQINVAAVREDDSQLALIVQSTFDGGMNPLKKTAWFLSVDGGATWTKTSVPDTGWSPFTSTSVFSSYYDMGGPNVRSTASGARAATHDMPFVVTATSTAGASGIFAVSRDGSVKQLAIGNSALILGENAARDRFLVSYKPGLLSTVDLSGNVIDVGNISAAYDGWIGADGSAYAITGYAPSNRSLLRFTNGVATKIAGAAGANNSAFLAVPTADYSGTWMIERATGSPTNLELYTPQTGIVTKWSEISGPEVEALHAGASGKTLLIQVHRQRNLTDTFRDPALAVWHVGDPAPRSYDELYMTEQTSKAFVHVDPDAIENGTPFVFDSGQSTGGCPSCLPPIISPAPPSAGGGDVVQEWGVVRASLAQKLVLPGISRTPGAFGSYWLSDVTFYNPTDVQQRINVHYVPTGDGPQTADVKERTVTLAAREIRLIPDVLKTLFDLNTGGGAFFITPELGGGVNVTSRTYSQAAKGTYGFGMNGIDYYSAVGPRFALTFSGAFFGANTRTNLVLTDVSGRGTSVSLRAANSQGFVTSGPADSAVAPPNGQQQVNLLGPRVGLQPNEAGGLLLQPLTGELIASVIAIDNRTNDPTYFPPDIPATVARTIPAIGHVDGANNSKFRSDLYLFNPAPTPSTISLQINPWDGGAQSSLSLTLLGNEARVIRDVYMTAFGRSGVARLRYQSYNNSGGTASVRVTSRTYSINDDGGTYGFLMPPLNSFQSAAAGDSLEILGTTTDSSVRTNIGLVDLMQNFTGRASTAIISFYDKTGTKIDEMSVIVGSAAGFQLGDVYRARNISPDIGPVLVRVTSVNGLIGAYGASVDNGTNDSTYLPANLAAKQ